MAKGKIDCIERQKKLASRQYVRYPLIYALGNLRWMISESTADMSAATSGSIGRRPLTGWRGFKTFEDGETFKDCTPH
jgi:hypothetical protein